MELQPRFQAVCKSVSPLDLSVPLQISSQTAQRQTRSALDAGHRPLAMMLTVLSEAERFHCRYQRLVVKRQHRA